MKIAVCIKQVPDTGSAITISPDKTGIVTGGMEYVINPYDEYALEAALALKDKDNSINVTAVTAGSARCGQALISSLAVGADRGIFVNIKEDRSYDSYFAAQLVGEAIGQAGFDLVFCGLQGADYNNGQFPFYLANKLNLPVVTNIYGIDLAEGEKHIHAVRLNTDGSKTVFDVKLPAILSFSKGKTPLRYASLTGIVKAKNKEVTMVKVDEAVVSKLCMPFQIKELYQSEQKRDNVIISDTDGTAASRLFAYLASNLKAVD